MKYLLFFFYLFLIIPTILGQTSVNENSSLSFEEIPKDGHKDTLANETKSLHGIYLEILGKNGYYSLGYEYQILKKKHSFGIGSGLSYRIIPGPGIKYSNFSINISPFYEFGRDFGVRFGLNAGISVNPVMFSDDLDYLVYANKPPVYILIPSMEVGAFYRTKKKRFQFTLSAYAVYFYSHYVERNAGRMRPWFGASIKYNFKIKE